VSPDVHVSSINEQNATDLFLHVWHIKMSQAFDWASHIGNCPDA